MERLTYDFCLNGTHCNQVKGADNLMCDEVCRKISSRGCESCPISAAFDRLSAIENILGDDYDLDRLRELVEADRDGRVKILPVSEENTCGACGHFHRTPGLNSGTCDVKSRYKNKWGQ